MYIPLTYTIWSFLKALGSLFSNTPGSGFNPVLYHLVNVIMHAINGLLVYYFLLRLLKSRTASFIGSLFFLIHPLQVESVAFVSELRSLLAFSFTMASVLLHMRRRSDNLINKTPISPAIGSWCLYFLAVVSKPSAMILPGLIFLIDMGYYKLHLKKAVITVLPYILLALPLSIITISVQTPPVIYPLWVRPILWLDSLNFYLYKLIFPTHLALAYGRTADIILGQNTLIIGLTIPVIIGIIVFIMKKQSPFLMVSYLWVVVALLPVSNLLSFMFQAWSTVADRFFYLPMVGVSLLIAVGVKKVSTPSMWIVTTLCLISLSAWSYFVQIPVWKNEYTLWNHSLNIVPHEPHALNNRGSSLLDMKRINEAISDFSEAIQLDSTFAEAYLNRGLAYERSGRLEAAIEDFTHAVRINNKFRSAYYNRGRIYKTLEKYPQALSDFIQTIHLKRNHVDAWNNLGIILGEMDASDLALEAFNRALVFDQRNTYALINRGNILRKMEKYEEALDAYTTALQINSEYAQAYANRGRTYLLMDLPTQALDDFNKAIVLNPKHGDTYYLRAVTLYVLGKLDSARSDLKKVARYGGHIDSTFVRIIKK